MGGTPRWRYYSGGNLRRAQVIADCAGGVQLRRSATLIRLTPIAGLVWGSFSFIMTVTDLLTR